MEVCESDRRAFAERLLEFTQVRRPAPSAVSMVGTGMAARLSLRRRLRMLFDHRVSGRLSFTSLGLAGVLGLAVLPGFMRADESESDDGRESESHEVTLEFAGEKSADERDSSPVIVEAEAELVLTNDEVESGDVVPAKSAEEQEGFKRKLLNDDHKRKEWFERVVKLLGVGEKSQVLKIHMESPNVVVIEERGPNWTSTRKVVLDEKALEEVDMKPTKGAFSIEFRNAVGKALPATPQPPQPPQPVAPPAVEVPADSDFAQAARELERAKAELARELPARIKEAHKRAREEHDRAAEAMKRQLATNVEALKEEVTLAEIGVMERRIELEEVAEQAKKSPDDPGIQRRLKLAELGVRRAEIELSRAKRQLGEGERVTH
jgi:hypothetical protein